ncbi:MAG: HepT-like ribonuclease domain-containing protein [Melioribacteraceae bacterium]|nr:HepT-like ribonuclease domain-containing protein [Melioribacteraceae bacterium]
MLKATENLNYESLSKSEIYTRAASRSFEIIGEAVKKLLSDFRGKHKNIEWKKIEGMRDKIIHEYFNVDYEILWYVIQNKLS